MMAGRSATVASLVLVAAAVLAAAGGADDDGSVRAHLRPEDGLYRSPLHLAVSDDGSHLLVVCTNTSTVQVVDTASGEVLATIPVGRRPYGIALGPRGRRAYVTNSWDDTVSVLDLEDMTEVATFATGHDPHGVIVDHAGQYLYVANLADSSLSIIAVETGVTIKRLRTGVKPVELALSPDGRHVLVSNLLTDPVPFRSPPKSQVTIVDTAKQIVVDRRELAGANICQGIAVAPQGDLAFVAVEIPKNLIPETQIYQGWMVTYAVAVLETRPGGRAAFLLLDEMDRYSTDPFGVALSPNGETLYVTSSGVDTMAVVDVAAIRRLLRVEAGRIGIGDETVALYARHLGLSTEYVRARVPTGFNPKGVAVSADGARVYVANRLSDSVSAFDSRTLARELDIELGGPTTVTKVRRGDYLFNHAQISFQNQLSCSTCHPENNVDGLLYDIAVDGGLGGNLVDNRTLRGVAHTAPFKWNGKNPSLMRQEGPRAAQLFFRSRGFTGADQEAIVAYIEAVPLYPNPHRRADGLTPAQKRGKAIFERSRTNGGRYIPIGNRCVTCHPAPRYTARQMNDVGTRAFFDTNGEFDTPQLTGVATTAPYLHDGRCWSMEEIWTLYNPYDLHGVANDLTKQQLNDLIEYLKTL